MEEVEEVIREAGEDERGKNEVERSTGEEGAGETNAEVKEGGARDAVKEAKKGEEHVVVLVTPTGERIGMDGRIIEDEEEKEEVEEEGAKEEAEEYDWMSADPGRDEKILSRVRRLIPTEVVYDQSYPVPPSDLPFASETQGKILPLNMTKTSQGNPTDIGYSISTAP